MRGKRRLEITAIYMSAALLAVSLTGLAGNTVVAVQATQAYPDLYAPKLAEIVFPEQKTAYFTFDDGPSRNTEKILDILAEENIKATFFVCAQQSDDVEMPALLRRILAEGHEIGLHSYSHDFNKIYRSLDAYLADLNAINQYIIDATGYRSNIVRFPGGSGTRNASPQLMKSIAEEITRRGYRYYDWDVESGDSNSGCSAEYLCKKICKAINDKPRMIILLHDSPAPKTSPQAVRLAIPILRENGYVFDKLTASVDPEKHYG